jgi:O-antigen ligase
MRMIMPQRLRLQTRLLSPEFGLLVVLLFSLPMEGTYFGRGYNYLVGLNSAAMDELTSTATMSIVYLGMIGLECLFMFTILVPTAIVLFSRSAQARCSASYLIWWGLGLWVLGGAISTLGHLDQPTTVLNFFADMVSSAAVYMACRRVRMSSIRHYELVFRAIATGFLFPLLYDLFRYYRQWGVPTISTAIAEKYDVPYWSSNSMFGNPDNAACAYYLVFALSVCFSVQRQISGRTRVLAYCTLALSALMIVVTMARQFILLAAITIVSTWIFERKKRLLAMGVCGLVALALLTSGDSFPITRAYFAPALTYDTNSDSVSSRIYSMQQGWEAFRENPVIGLGPGESFNAIDVTATHQLAISQAAEVGFFGFVGVLLVTLGCLWRFVGLLRAGPSTAALTLEYAFFVGPSLYFASGLLSEVATNSSVINTWICVVFASIGIAETTRNSGLVSAGTVMPSSAHSQRSAVVWATAPR